MCRWCIRTEYGTSGRCIIMMSRYIFITCRYIIIISRFIFAADCACACGCIRLAACGWRPLLCSLLYMHDGADAAGCVLLHPVVGGWYNRRLTSWCNQLYIWTCMCTCICACRLYGADISLCMCMNICIGALICMCRHMCWQKHMPQWDGRLYRFAGYTFLTHAQLTRTPVLHSGWSSRRSHHHYSI